MADSEIDFARFSSHNGTYQYNYLPRLSFAPEGSRNLTAPLPSNYPPRQSTVPPENPHHHPAPLESNYTSRRAASTDQARHHNGIHHNAVHHNPSFLSRHDPGSVNTRQRNSAINYEGPYLPPIKNPVEQPQPQPHQHGCPTCDANNNYHPPQRTSSQDSFHNTGNTFTNEDMSEEAALQKIKTAQSVNMSPELFEKLYLNPQTPVKGDYRKTFANPTPIALIGYVLSLTPLSCDYMGWRGAGGGGAASVGVYYFMGGVLMLLGGILEFILGNTFSSVVFCSYGGYWFAWAATFTSFYGGAAPYGGSTSSPGYESSWAFFLLFMGLLSFIYLICSLRTNVMFVVVFAGLMIGFLVEAGAYWNNALGNTELGSTLFVGAGALYFVADLAGWWVLFSQLLQSVDFPIQIPVGDISHLIKGYSDRPKSSKKYNV
ncbi:hypothetical protein MMC13_006909 [Lambiella insularis]|nr:hypothetical protein [Lambiella insularis]